MRAEKRVPDPGAHQNDHQENGGPPDQRAHPGNPGLDDRPLFSINRHIHPGLFGALPAKSRTDITKLFHALAANGFAANPAGFRCRILRVPGTKGHGCGGNRGGGSLRNRRRGGGNRRHRGRGRGRGKFLANHLVGQIRSVRAATGTIDPHRHPAVYRLDVKRKARSARALDFDFHD